MAGPAAGQTFAVYEFNFKSGLPTETLKVDWISQDGGTVILQAASWADVAAPPAPTNFNGSAYFANRIFLSWTDNAPNENDYVPNINSLVKQNCKLVVTVGGLMVAYCALSFEPGSRRRAAKAACPCCSRATAFARDPDKMAFARREPNGAGWPSSFRACTI